ncbi:hypothetical protein EYC80_006934 [Monilinia laxa]|uniref:Uncharacterized protein n=1 Tax=Monilinia laxa TaxID=61186 RepID=A0A5N6JZN7_MONLA|nr:hypothetical protein EYC80_006934 [Monilinia laxa]
MDAFSDFKLEAETLACLTQLSICCMVFTNISLLCTCIFPLTTSFSTSHKTTNIKHTTYNHMHAYRIIPNYLSTSHSSISPSLQVPLI